MNKVTTATTLSYRNQPLENSTEITYISKIAKVSIPCGTHVDSLENSR